MNNTVHEDKKVAPMITLPEQYMKVPFLVFFIMVQVKAVKVKPGKTTHKGCGIDGELLSVSGRVICSILPEQCRLIGRPASHA